MNMAFGLQVICLELINTMRFMMAQSSKQCTDNSKVKTNHFKELSILIQYIRLHRRFLSVLIRAHLT